MKIDWKRYYKEFSSLHGGNPVEEITNPELPIGSGKMLFQDGWVFDRKIIAEYPPPKDEEQHKALIKKYWTIRCRALRTRYNFLREDIKSMTRAQQMLNATLPVTRFETHTDIDDSGREVKRRKRIDEWVNFDLMLEQLKDLKAEIQCCEEMLSDIKIPEKVNGADTFDHLGVLTKLDEIDK